MTDLATFITTELAPAINSHSIDRVMQYFDRNAVVNFATPPPGFPKTLNGKGEIKKYLEQVIGYAHIEPKDVNAKGDHVEWKADIRSDLLGALGLEAVEGRVSMTVKNNKIVNFSPTIAPDAVQRIWQAAQERARTKASAGSRPR